MLLDVVYNHVGPGNEALTRLRARTSRAKHHTFWGDAIDYEQGGVREWAIQNAEQWVRDYHVDGLRLDAVHAIFDDSRVHICAELAERVHALNPRALVISEIETDDWRPIDEWGHDAQWVDTLPSRAARAAYRRAGGLLRRATGRSGRSHETCKDGVTIRGAS